MRRAEICSDCYTFCHKCISQKSYIRQVIHMYEFLFLPYVVLLQVWRPCLNASDTMVCFNITLNICIIHNIIGHPHTWCVRNWSGPDLELYHSADSIRCPWLPHRWMDPCWCHQVSTLVWTWPLWSEFVILFHDSSRYHNVPHSGVAGSISSPYWPAPLGLLTYYHL